MQQIEVKNTNTAFFTKGRLPILLYAGKVANEPEWNFHAHSHVNHCEIIYISSGEGSYVIDGQHYTAQKGDILIYNKGIIHQESSNFRNPLQTYFCGVSNLFIQNVEEGLLLPKEIAPVIHANQYAGKVARYISEIYKECQSKDAYFEMVAENHLRSLIVLIHRIISACSEQKASSEQTELGNQIKEYIDENYTQNITLATMAKTLYVSPYYISHLFKHETGDSPIHYLITRRIGEAKNLLLTTRMPLQDIALAVGYENVNHFIDIFKKKTGISPGRFRNENKY